MTSSCSTNLPSTSFSATCSHEAEMNGENFAKLGFCHSHEHYAFVYIRRFNSLIHCQFLLFFVSSLNCSRLVLITTASQMHQNQSSQIFFECAIRMLLHIPKLRAISQRGKVLHHTGDGESTNHHFSQNMRQTTINIFNNI